MSDNTELPPLCRGQPPTETKTCDVPYCDKTCEATIMFDNTNITCMKCNKFHCNDCSAQIWKGEWNGNVFHKPNLNFLGLRHEVFQCAFCRSTFDRMLEPGCERCGDKRPECGMSGFDFDGVIKWYCKTCPHLD